MRGINNYIDFLLFLLCYFLYAWQASCFLKRHLQGKSSERGAFFGLLFCSHGVMAFYLERESIPYILYAMCNHVMLVGLTIAVFKGDREKKKNMEEEKKTRKEEEKKKREEGRGKDKEDEDEEDEKEEKMRQRKTKWLVCDSHGTCGGPVTYFITNVNLKYGLTLASL